MTGATDPAVIGTRILVADPLRFFRTGVRHLLARESDFEVVEAGTLNEVLTVVGERMPRIALIDLDLPPRGGVAAVRELSGSPFVTVVVWSLRPAREAVVDALRAGAHGFLHKDISRQGLVQALRGALRGEAPLARDLAPLAIEALHELNDHVSALEHATVLSAREREVLDLVARGARNKQIAAALAISEFTVKRHVQNILHKLEVPSRHAAATFYRAAVGGRA